MDSLLMRDQASHPFRAVMTSYPQAEMFLAKFRLVTRLSSAIRTFNVLSSFRAVSNSQNMHLSLYTRFCIIKLNACTCIAFADEIEGEIRRTRILFGGRHSRLFMEKRGERLVLELKSSAVPPFQKSISGNWRGQIREILSFYLAGK